MTDGGFRDEIERKWGGICPSEIEPEDDATMIDRQNGENSGLIRDGFLRGWMGVCPMK